MTTRPYLATPAAARAVLQKHGLHTQKKYGQNFLIDAHIPEKIVEAAAVTEEDCILEIGPGIGTLTQFLAEKAGCVIAVEIDTKLIPVLEETLADYPQVHILNCDILQTDLSALLAEYAADRPVKVVANLPYYITTPILMTMLEAHLPVVSYTLMVQKEVADRMQAGPGSKDYGALSLAVQYFTEPHVVMQVSPNCFLPAPQVGSTVIQLSTKKESRPHPMLFGLVRAAFQQRRKTLANALRNSGELSFSREEIEAAIASCGFRPDIRGEALGLDEFLQLAAVLAK